MSDITDTKPEPISAKPNWHYDSYFLAQLERLNLRKFEVPSKKQPKVTIKQDKQDGETLIEKRFESDEDNES
ncbi:hypothetical protein IVG45_18210 [Methylomonas sp. LL1]|uniref:hypothetical protein n=1 Tax=Methylomonas sp. LL1 TaxID=2785785 RepID=UPI0018C3587F|nr:hypothetical protein [Methylomonas sp. LL1]QPK62746.1 hypothetical protein IVG45_18210 [Methylomonas sp. LL1]